MRSWASYGALLKHSFLLIEKGQYSRVSMSVWTRGHIFYTLGYNLILIIYFVAQNAVALGIESFQIVPVSL